MRTIEPVRIAHKLPSTVPAPRSASTPPPPAVPRLVELSASELEPVDPVETLFEAMHAIDHQPDALDAARFCLNALQEVIPCRASLVHLFDVARTDFLVVDAIGDSASTMVLCRQSTQDPLLRVAMPSGRPFAWNNLRSAPVNRLARFEALGDVRAVLVCPIMYGVRHLGAIELVDPTSKAPFRSADEHAARYVAERLAHYLNEHGGILDVATIARHVFHE